MKREFRNIRWLICLLFTDFFTANDLLGAALFVKSCQYLCLFPVETSLRDVIHPLKHCRVWAVVIDFEKSETIGADYCAFKLM